MNEFLNRINLWKAVFIRNRTLVKLFKRFRCTEVTPEQFFCNPFALRAALACTRVPNILIRKACINETISLWVFYRFINSPQNSNFLIEMLVSRCKMLIFWLVNSQLLIKASGNFETCNSASGNLLRIFVQNLKLDWKCH